MPQGKRKAGDTTLYECSEFNPQYIKKIKINFIGIKKSLYLSKTDGRLHLIGKCRLFTSASDGLSYANKSTL